MPVPGTIGRIAAKSMLGVEAEDITKAVESLTAQTEGEAEALRELAERSRLENRAESENKAKVYILKEQYRQLDPAKILKHEEKAHCVLIPAEEYEIQKMNDAAVPYTMSLTMPYLEMPSLAMYDLPHVKGGRYHKPPRDLKNKKKAKRRQQKQSRRKR